MYLSTLGAWYGSGRKAAWWSPILLAVWDPFKEEFVAVCKCMSGKRVERRDDRLDQPKNQDFPMHFIRYRFCRQYYVFFSVFKHLRNELGNEKEIR